MPPAYPRPPSRQRPSTLPPYSRAETQSADVKPHLTRSPLTRASPPWYRSSTCSRAMASSVALVYTGALGADWKRAFFFGETPPEAKFGQLLIDVDGKVAEIPDVRVRPRALPKSGTSTATAGTL